MTYSELKQIFQELKRTSPRENLTAHIIFTEDSFAKEYPLLSRTYRVSSDNKGFYPHMFSKSIFAYCLDVTSDQGVRLDWCLAGEGNPGGWKVETCYILEKMLDAEAMSDLTRIELEDDTICCGFGSSSTCIRVCETTENGKVQLEPLAGNQRIDGKWVGLAHRPGIWLLYPAGTAVEQGGRIDMRILVVEPERRPELREIDGSLESMQEIVGGLIQPVYLFNDDNSVVLVCNDEGKLMNLPANRGLRDKDGQIYDIVFGTFFLCSAPDDSDSFTSLTPEQIERYRKRFHTPEMFWGMNGRIVCIPMEMD